MDRLSHLPDELILRILSFRGNTKDVVATMVLSKRWKFLWMFMPIVYYDDSYQNPEYEKFSKFVHRSLVLHDAQVIETLCFKLGKTCGSGDIQVWIKAADKRCVRKLIIKIDTCSSNKTQVTLPRSLYTCCRLLVTLELSNAVLVDDVTSPISFPFLKKLRLDSMKYPRGGEFVNKLLSSCPVLEDLFVKQSKDDNVPDLRVRVSSLKRLVVHKSASLIKINSHGFVIDAPSLEFLDIVDDSYGLCDIKCNITKIVYAKIVVNHWDPWKKFLGSITSAKRLYLCLETSKDAYPVGSIFSYLVHLKICTCEPEWLNLLMRVLKDSPGLRALRLEQCHDLRPKEPRPSWNPCWNEPNSVPECLLSSLETFEWVKYEGAEEEKEAVAFIFRSTKCLKKATIITSKSIVDSDKKIEVIKELFLSSRRSPACQLAFG